jgi:tetratricopeptide (TPR) repeat protein
MSSRQALELELARLTERYAEQPSGRVFAPLADCHRKLGQLDTALQICLTGLARHPRYSSAQLILGKIFLDRGEDVPAREALEKVLELDGQNLLAIRLLAEIAERLDEIDEAIARWRQLAVLEFEPELTQERLEALSARREAAVAEPVPETEDDQEPEADAVATEDVGETGDEVAEPAPQTAPASVEEPDFDLGHSREIATLTLAGIYAEQGFRTKALEIYNAILERNPDLPGLRAKIASVEAAMARVEERAAEDVPGDEGDGGLEIVATSPVEPREEDDTPPPTPSEPLFSDAPSAPDPVEEDAGRYHRFGAWLERVKSDDED